MGKLSMTERRARYDDILRRREAGESWGQIGAAYGLSRQGLARSFAVVERYGFRASGRPRKGVDKGDAER